MCRALLYLGSRTRLDDLLYKPDNALVKQACNPRMLNMLNLAGFGMKAWDEASDAPGIPYSYSADWLPVFDRNLSSLAQKVYTDCLLAHVRGVPNTPEAAVSMNNAHPFCFPGCKISLAHNGDLANFHDMKAQLYPHIDEKFLAHIEGTTDSEWIYALLLSQLDNPAAFIDLAELKQAIEAVYRIIREVRARCGIDTWSSANLFISDGRHVAAVRYCFDFGRYAIDDVAAGHDCEPEYLSLWYTLGREYGYLDGEWKTIGGAESADTVIIASEPLTADISTWLEVPEYSMLSASTSDGKPEITLDYLGV
jgi:glutamine amidotransferase